MGAPVEEEQILTHQVRVGEPGLDVAELQVDQLLQVALVAVLVDAGLGVRHGVFSIGDGAERLVVDGDQIQCRCGGLLARRRDGRDRIAYEAHLVERQRVLVLAHGEDAKGDRQVRAREHRFHTRECCGLRRVDADDAGVRVRTAEQLRVQHPGQEEIVRELRDTGYLGGRIDLAVGLPDHPEGVRRLLTAVHTATPPPASRPRLGGGPRPALPPRRS